MTNTLATIDKPLPYNTPETEKSSTTRGGHALPQPNNSNKNPFSYGFSVLMDMMEVMQILANTQYRYYEKSAAQARNTQAMSNRVDEVIANLAKENDPKKTAKIPKDVFDYMKKNGIQVNGQDIDAYAGENGGKDLDKGQLQAVKAALDNSANRDMDFMNQGQILMQKSLQQLSTLTSQTTGLLSKWNDLLNMISQKTFS